MVKVMICVPLQDVEDSWYQTITGTGMRVYGNHIFMAAGRLRERRHTQPLLKIRSESVRCVLSQTWDLLPSSPVQVLSTASSSLPMC